jgi:hypothetical protein
MMRNGLLCVLINVRAYKIIGVKTLTFFILSMNGKEKVGKLLRLDNSGKLSLTHKSKLELLTCFIRTHAIVSQISKI